jgi:hypothetical protein
MYLCVFVAIYCLSVSICVYLLLSIVCLSLFVCVCCYLLSVCLYLCVSVAIYCLSVCICVCLLLSIVYLSVFVCVCCYLDITEILLKVALNTITLELIHVKKIYINNEINLNTNYHKICFKSWTEFCKFWMKSKTWLMRNKAMKRRLD